MSERESDIHPKSSSACGRWSDARRYEEHDREVGSPVARHCLFDRRCRFSQENPGAPAALKNPVPATAASLSAGKSAYDTNCAGCHGNKAQGAEKAGVVISIIQEQGGKQPPDLTDDKWDHGSTDGEIYTVIKKGVPPTMMAGWDGRLSDTDIWNIVNYLRARAGEQERRRGARGGRSEGRTADTGARRLRPDADHRGSGGENTRAELARVNFMRDEPGSRRFFINDLNGPLYILDKQTRQFTTYLDFNGLAGRPGLFQRFTFERNFATGLINFIFDPDYARNGIFYTIHMEDPTIEAPAEPRSGVVPGLDLSRYQTTPAIQIPTLPGQKIDREAVIIEWTDRNTANSTFEGTAREVLRTQLSSPIHPLGEMTFNPTARPGDPDWRVMYVGSGDSGTGEQHDIRRLNPAAARQHRRKNPAHRSRPARAHRHDDGERERALSHSQRQSVRRDRGGAQGDLGARACAIRIGWSGTSIPREPRRRACSRSTSGSPRGRRSMIVRKGANYGYPLREGPQAMTRRRDGGRCRRTTPSRCRSPQP